MNRRSLIKSLFTIAVAPKVLAELNLDAPKVAKNGFAGLIPTILNQESTIRPRSFTIADFNRLIEQKDKMYKPKYYWHEQT